MDQNLVQSSERSSSRCFLSFKCLHAFSRTSLCWGWQLFGLFSKRSPMHMGKQTRQNWRLFSLILLLQECSVLKLHHRTDDQYKGSKSCLCRFEEKEKSGNKLVSKRIFSKSLAPQLMSNANKVSLINSSSKARTWTSQRWLVILCCFSPGLDAGKRVEIEIWVVQPFPLFSAKLISLCP